MLLSEFSLIRLDCWTAVERKSSDSSVVGSVSRIWIWGISILPKFLLSGSKVKCFVFSCKKKANQPVDVRDVAEAHIRAAKRKVQGRWCSFATQILSVGSFRSSSHGHCFGRHFECAGSESSVPENVTAKHGFLLLFFH